MPRLSNELKELKQKVFDSLGDALKQRSVQPEVKPVEEPEDPELVRFREEYGEEHLRILDKIADRRVKTAVETALKQYAEQLAPVQQKVDSVEDTQIKAAQQNFIAYLSDKVEGDWKSLWQGKDEKFNEFLDRPDPSGLYTYGQLAQMYNDNWDADRLATLFNLYLKEQNPPQPEQAPPPSNPAKDAAKDAMVAPRRSTQHTAPPSTDKRVWTPQMIEDFKRADRANKYSAEESQAMWDDLLAALRENRIRP